MSPRTSLKSSYIKVDTCEGAVPAHPLGVRPTGNAYTAETHLKSVAGHFALLPDEVLVQVLEQLDATALRTVGNTCKALYAYTRLDDLWKTLCVERSTSIKTWQGTWLSTYYSLSPSRQSKIDCTGLYSDVLHRPFLCAHTPLTPYTTSISSCNSIPRLNDLSHREFATDWAGKPFILTNPVKKWPIYQTWSISHLLTEHSSTSFRAEAVDWPLSTYVHYMQNNIDESPLYLFDRSFVPKMSLTVSRDTGDYHPPACFGTDLFSVLGTQRPDHRWLIIGPARSGSTFHKDPNATSAWNAVIRGAKYWIMFPSNSSSPPPPGVFVSEDQSEITSPLSIAEWLLGFHAEARRTPGCMEGVCGKGEVLHVPSGWWHLVINLEESIAITQNFVPEKHLGQVLDFLRNRREQVSGFAKTVANPYDLFVEKMKIEHPELLQEGMDGIEKAHERRKRKWGELVKVSPNRNDENKRMSVGFSFGFGDEDDNDVS